MKKSTLLIWCLLISTIPSLIFKLPLVRSSVLVTLNFCANILIPSIFPLLTVCRFAALLLIRNATLKKDTKRRLLIMLGWIGGYPFGATLIKDSPENKSSAERDICLISCGSAGFVIQTVGASFCCDFMFGVCLYISQILFSVLTAPQNNSNSSVSITRQSPNATNAASFFECFTQAVRDSAVTMLYITSFTIVFSFLSDLISSFFPYTLLGG